MLSTHAKTVRRLEILVLRGLWEAHRCRLLLLWLLTLRLRRVKSLLHLFGELALISHGALDLRATTELPHEDLAGHVVATAAHLPAGTATGIGTVVLHGRGPGKDLLQMLLLAVGVVLIQRTSRLSVGTSWLVEWTSVRVTIQTVGS